MHSKNDEKLLKKNDEKLLKEIDKQIKKYAEAGIYFNDRHFEKNLGRNWKRYEEKFRKSVALLGLSNDTEGLEMLPYPLDFVNTMIILAKDEKMILEAFDRKQINNTINEATAVADIDSFEKLD